MPQPSDDEALVVVLFEREGVDAGLRALADRAGTSPAESAESTDGGLESLDAAPPEVLVLRGLGVALVRAQGDRVDRVASTAAGGGPVKGAWRARRLALPRFSLDTEEAVAVDEREVTWGLRRTGAVDAGLTGRGVAVAVLDTGIDLTHPAFDGRSIATASFLPGPDARDEHGHGTHCAGTLVGRAVPEVPRFGVAPGLSLYCGRVVDDAGETDESVVLRGIDWAIRMGCRVVSLSAGRLPSTGPDPDYEEIGRRCLDAGCLVVAAAGNDSARPNTVAPVRTPADAVSVLAVGALTPAGYVSNDSNGGVHVPGGAVDLVAPGASVLSAWPGGVYQRASGTSCATPFVAAVAALWLEREPTLTAGALWRRLRESASAVPGAALRDVGAGMVRAPPAPA